MTRMRIALAGLLAVLALSVSPVQAQTTLNSTTTTAAVVRDLQLIPLTSVTSIAAGDYLFFDSEVALVTGACDTSALTCPVRRGAASTLARPHASGVVVWSGPPRRFSLNETVAGQCTAAAIAYLPKIVLPIGDMYDCKNSEWVRIRDRGTRTQDFGRSDGGTTYTAAGAITVQPGVSFINGSTLAMTLANPTTEQNGMVMFIISTNASAHTVTNTTGFGGGTTSRDVATFGGAVNDELVIVAFNGVWWVISTRNVTLG